MDSMFRDGYTQARRVYEVREQPADRSAQNLVNFSGFERSGPEKFTLDRALSGAMKRSCDEHTRVQTSSAQPWVTAGTGVMPFRSGEKPEARAHPSSRRVSVRNRFGSAHSDDPRTRRTPLRAVRRRRRMPFGALRSHRLTRATERTLHPSSLGCSETREQPADRSVQNLVNFSGLERSGPEKFTIDRSGLRCREPRKHPKCRPET